jgi:hypothetical protein
LVSALIVERRKLTPTNSHFDFEQGSPFNQNKMAAFLAKQMVGNQLSAVKGGLITSSFYHFIMSRARAKL